MTLAQEMAQYALSINECTISPDTRRIAQEIIRDCIGCILGGIKDWPVRKVAEYYKNFKTDSNASSTVAVTR